MDRQNEFNGKLQDLREKVVDKGVFGSEEAIELIDAMLVVSTGQSGEPEKVIDPPPTTEPKTAKIGEQGVS